MSTYPTGRAAVAHTMTKPVRLAGTVTLGSRMAAAAFANRHEDTIRRYCQPVACDTTTKALLYDLDTVLIDLQLVHRRHRRVA